MVGCCVCRDCVECKHFKRGPLNDANSCTRMCRDEISLVKDLCERLCFCYTSTSVEREEGHSNFLNSCPMSVRSMHKLAEPPGTEPTKHSKDIYDRHAIFGNTIL